MVVAVGGNALTLPDQAGTAAEIEANAQAMAQAISGAIAAGWRVVVADADRRSCARGRRRARAAWLAAGSGSACQLVMRAAAGCS